MQQRQERVRIDNLSKSFTVKLGKESKEVQALENVSFTVADGEVIALTGVSGCGKTTMLRIIMGLERASSGEVILGGEVVTGCGYDRGLVFQHSELFPWRSALANVEFGLEVKGVPKAERTEIAREKLKLVGLADSMGRMPNQLSGGMKQRVGLARALSADPQVLLMDEPFAALDAQTREGLQVELLRIHEKTGKTIIFVTHDLDEAVMLADRVVLLSPNPGRINQIFDIDIPRPRTDILSVFGSDEFKKKRQEIWLALMNEVVHGNTETAAAVA